MKNIVEIFISKLGRKNKYIGVYGKSSCYPVVYFRKSKFATQEEFDTILSEIFNNFKKLDND